jgi:hypothetical protein
MHTKTAAADAKKYKLRIIATAIHKDRDDSFYVARFSTVDGKERERLVLRSLFNNPQKVADLLLSWHAELPDDPQDQQKLIRRALSNRNSRKYSITSTGGWHGDSFLFAGRTYGPSADDLRLEQGSGIDSAFGKRAGTLEEWKDGLAKPCKKSDFLVFAIAASGAGPLLDLVGETEGAIFHFHGGTSKGINPIRREASSGGKTLAARASASAMGACAENDLFTFGMTRRAFEDYCHLRNNLTAYFDEQGRSINSGQHINIRDLPYALASGRGAVRSNKAARDPDLPNLTWSLFAISTGEQPLDGPGAGGSRAEGAQVRMIPLLVPPGSEGGIFNRIKGSSDEVARIGKALARKVNTTVRSNYGHAIRAYLDHIVPNKDRFGRRTRRIVDQFVQRVAENGDPWDQRLAEKFGFVLAAAIFLSELGIAPWTRKQARRAVRRMYDVARRSLATALPMEQVIDKIVDRILTLVKKGKRFPDLGSGTPSPKQTKLAWGVVKQSPGIGRIVLIPLARMKFLVPPHMGVNTVLDELYRRRLLLKGSDGKRTRQVMIKALYDTRRRRYVCLRLFA